MGRGSKAFQIFAETTKRVRILQRDEASASGVSLEERHLRMGKWARDLLSIIEIDVKSNEVPLSRPSLFVGNHVSYLDIPVLMSQTPVVFVAKRELASWPVFGTAMKSVGTIFVNRESKESRKSVAATVAPYLLEKKQSVAIFPAGTTTLNEDKPWRWGAFALAKEHRIPVVPFRLTYHPLRAAAYLMEDSFPVHLWKLLGSGEMRVEIEFHPGIMVEDPAHEAMRWWNWVKQTAPAEDQRAS